ncbi:MAG: hypothetical protein JRC89_09990 [Deltaproteobacteria bacterium]|nr:hypothetical protein [Deltaproteobacteria bacterium]
MSSLNTHIKFDAIIWNASAPEKKYSICSLRGIMIAYKNSIKKTTAAGKSLIKTPFTKFPDNSDNFSLIILFFSFSAISLKRSEINQFTKENIKEKIAIKKIVNSIGGVNENICVYSLDTRNVIANR